MNGSDLRQWRDTYAVTQGQLAEWLGIAKNSVSRWERGGAEIPPYFHFVLDQLTLRMNPQPTDHDAKIMRQVLYRIAGATMTGTQMRDMARAALQAI